MKQYKIWHNRPECTACGACVAIDDNWYLDDDDSLASARKIVITEAELEANKEAAEVCPVNIIHIAEGDEVPLYFQELGILEQPSGKKE
jgi:ferredoxin